MLQHMLICCCVDILTYCIRTLICCCIETHTHTHIGHQVYNLHDCMKVDQYSYSFWFYMRAINSNVSYILAINTTTQDRACNVKLWEYILGVSSGEWVWSVRFRWPLNVDKAKHMYCTRPMPDHGNLVSCICVP